MMTVEEDDAADHYYVYDPTMKSRDTFFYKRTFENPVFMFEQSKNPFLYHQKFDNGDRLLAHNLLVFVKRFISKYGHDMSRGYGNYRAPLQRLSMHYNNNDDGSPSSVALVVSDALSIFKHTNMFTPMNRAFAMTLRYPFTGKVADILSQSYDPKDEEMKNYYGANPALVGHFKYHFENLKSGLKRLQDKIMDFTVEHHTYMYPYEQPPLTWLLVDDDTENAWYNLGDQGQRTAFDNLFVWLTRATYILRTHHQTDIFIEPSEENQRDFEEAKRFVLGLTRTTDDAPGGYMAKLRTLYNHGDNSFIVVLKNALFLRKQRSKLTEEVQKKLSLRDHGQFQANPFVLSGSKQLWDKAEGMLHRENAKGNQKRGLSPPRAYSFPAVQQPDIISLKQVDIGLKRKPAEELFEEEQQPKKAHPAVALLTSPASSTKRKQGEEDLALTQERAKKKPPPAADALLLEIPDSKRRQEEDEEEEEEEEETQQVYDEEKRKKFILDRNTIRFEREAYLAEGLKDMMKKLDTYGVAIVEERILDEEGCKNIALSILRGLSDHMINFDFREKEKWKQLLRVLQEGRLFQHYGLNWLPGVQKVRELEGISKLFAALYGQYNRKTYAYERDMFVSSDSFYLYLNEFISQEGYSKASETIPFVSNQTFQDPKTELQGFLNLLGCRMCDGSKQCPCFLFLEGSHLHQQDFIETFFPEKVEKKSKQALWEIKNQGQLDYFIREKGCRPVCINAHGGDLVLWNSRLMHHKHYVPPRPNTEKDGFKAFFQRLVVYVSCQPKAYATPKDKKNKQKAYNELLNTNYLAAKGINIMGKGRRLKDSRLIIPVDVKPPLSDLGRSLLGLT